MVLAGGCLTSAGCGGEPASVWAEGTLGHSPLGNKGMLGFFLIWLLAFVLSHRMALYTEYLILTAQADGHGAVKLAGFVLTPKSTVNLVFSSLLITANTSAVLVLNAVGLL